MAVGVIAIVGGGLRVGVEVTCIVGVAVLVGVSVGVSVDDAVGVRLGAGVLVGLGVCVGNTFVAVGELRTSVGGGVGLAVGLGLGVAEGGMVAVGVADGEGVALGVADGTRVSVGVTVGDGVSVGVTVGDEEGVAVGSTNGRKRLMPPATNPTHISPPALAVNVATFPSASPAPPGTSVQLCPSQTCRPPLLRSAVTLPRAVPAQTRPALSTASAETDPSLGKVQLCHVVPS